MDSRDRQAVASFFDSPGDRPLLGIVYGRRRIGKSTMLVDLVEERGGFYYEAIRVERQVQLERLGAAIGAYLGVGRVVLESWEEAVAALLDLGRDGAVPVVLDEFGHLIAADPSLDSVITAAIGPGGRRRTSSRARLLLCGSAMSLMRKLTAGEAPLRGRAGLELLAQPDDFRGATQWLDPTIDHGTAAKVFAVIGGVVGYATDMVNFDLPNTASDFDRWVVDRVLSPAATLHREAGTLLAEDPLAGGRHAMLYNSVLGAIANGAVSTSAIAKRVGRPASNLGGILGGLVDAGFVLRHEDPVRDRRPLFALADPFLQFHYAVLEPHGPVLRGRDLQELWSQRLSAVFSSAVRGPVFEEMARTWALRYAADETLPARDHLGPSVVQLAGREQQVDLVVADAGPVPGERRIVALGEAKVGDPLSPRHLRHLEEVREALGARAKGAKLLLFGGKVHPSLVELAGGRSEVEIVDLERLYEGS